MNELCHSTAVQAHIPHLAPTLSLGSLSTEALAASSVAGTLASVTGYSILGGVGRYVALSYMAYVLMNLQCFGHVHLFIDVALVTATISGTISFPVICIGDIDAPGDIPLVDTDGRRCPLDLQSGRICV